MANGFLPPTKKRFLLAHTNENAGFANIKNLRGLLGSGKPSLSGVPIRDFLISSVRANATYWDLLLQRLAWASRTREQLPHADIEFRKTTEEEIQTLPLEQLLARLPVSTVLNSAFASANSELLLRRWAANACAFDTTAFRMLRYAGNDSVVQELENILDQSAAVARDHGTPLNTKELLSELKAHDPPPGSGAPSRRPRKPRPAPRAPREPGSREDYGDKAICFAWNAGNKCRGSGKGRLAKHLEKFSHSCIRCNEDHRFTKCVSSRIVT